MVSGIVDRLDHLIDDMWGCGEVRIPHPEIDDICTFSAGGYLQCIHLGKDIRRQSLYPMKLFSFLYHTSILDII